MQSIGTIEGNGIATIASHTRGNGNPLLRVIGKNRLEAKERVPLRSVVNDDIPASFDVDVESDTDEDTAEDTLRPRFIAALTAHCQSLVPLSAVVTDMIGAGIERDEAIDWGLEAGLSEGYVRSTVSNLYRDLTGRRVKAVGGGRKRNVSAAGFAEMALKASKDDVSAAKALLLAARRLIESWEKVGTVESNLNSLRAKSE